MNCCHTVKSPLLDFRVFVRLVAALQACSSLFVNVLVDPTAGVSVGQAGVIAGHVAFFIRALRRAGETLFEIIGQPVSVIALQACPCESKE